MKIKYPPKPKRAQGYTGGGMTERVFFPVYRFHIPNGYRQTSVDFGRGYLQALQDIKKLNPPLAKRTRK